jgi:hypothetical protein
MARRVVTVLALLAAWVTGVTMGVAGAALRTQTGRLAVVAWALDLANRAVTGSIEVGDVDGSFLRGLELREVVVRTDDGSTVVRAELVGVGYGIRELLRGRIVFGELRLLQPEITVVQVRPGAPFNFETLFPTDDRAEPRPGPLIAFGDVSITAGRIVVKTPVPDGAVGVRERERGPDGPLQVRRFKRLDGHLGYLRVSSPRRDDPILIEVTRLRTDVSDPVLSVWDLRGTARVWSDSLALDLSRVMLPQTEAQLEGTVTWSSGSLGFDLEGRASPAATDDVLGLVPALPAGLRGQARFEMRTPRADVLAFAGHGLDVRGLEGGRMRGRLGMILGPREQWAFEQTALELDDFDLEYVRGYLDTLPFVGRVTGRVAADGPAERLMLELDAGLRDLLVEGEPVSTARGSGIVALSDEDFVFRDFMVQEADISLATVRRLVPAMLLQGRLAGSGVLTGPWLNATFDGRLTHRDRPLPESAATGRLTLDARRDTLGAWAELVFDSLRLGGLRSSFEGLDLAGAWHGTVTIAGFVDSLALTARLDGDGGVLDLGGAFFFVEAGMGAHQVQVRGERLDLAQLSPQFPMTDLNGLIIGAGSFATDDRHPFRADVALGRSSVQRVNIDTATAVALLAPSRVTFDTLAIEAYALRIHAVGGMGLDTAVRDTLTFTAVTDSIGVFEPVLERILGPLETTDETIPRPSGSARAAGRVVGSVDEFQVVADIDLAQLRRADAYVSHAGGVFTWVSATRSLRLDASIDSMAVGAVALGDARVGLHGQLDSLGWHAQSRLGHGAWIGAGRWLRDSTVAELAFDSLGLSLASGPWFLDPGASVALDDSGLTFTELVLRNAQGPGVASVRGRWPFRGEGVLEGAIDGLQFGDVMVLAFRDPEDAAGELSGTFTLGGTARAPVLSLSANLRDVRYRNFSAPYTQGVFEYRDQRLRGDFELRRLGVPILSVTAELPVDLALASVERRRLPGPVSVRAHAEGVDLALLETTLPQVRETMGTFDADFGVEGTWEQPRLTGQLAIRNGSATFPALGVRHEAIDGRLSLSGDTVWVNELSLQSGSGTATVSGYVRFEELSKPILALRVASANFRAIDVRGFLTLATTGRVQLDGPLYQARLTGSATATRGVLYFADLVTKEIINLEDSLYAQFVDTALVRRQGLGAEFQSRFLDSLRIDSLRVDMGRDFWLRSTEANVQLAGNVFVSKVRKEYRLDGILEAPRGIYRLQLGLGTNRDFTVTRGQIRYLGTTDLNADLDIDARHVVRGTVGEDVNVNVHIGGTLYDPRLALSSDFQPPLSEPEIINYLVFGAPTLREGPGAGLDSRLFTQWLTTAFSGQLEYALISDLGVPLDYLQIRPTTTVSGLSGAEVAVGKQFQVLGTTAFLTASPRLCRRQATSFASIGASLEFRLSRQWLVAASVDPLTSCENPSAQSAVNYQFGADLFWEKHY